MIDRGTLVELLVDEVLPRIRKKTLDIYLVVDVEDAMATSRGRRAQLLTPDGRLIWESFYDLIPL